MEKSLAMCYNGCDYVWNTHGIDWRNSMDYIETHQKTLNGYEGLIVNVRLDKVAMPNGAVTLREVVEHPGGVTVIPVDEQGYVYCVRQYRYPMGEELLETPAGKLETGEDPLECAKRELSEETGISAKEYISLGKMYPSPGFCRETLYAYLATDLEYGEAHPDENELLNVEKVHIDELHRMIMTGELVDAKTVIAVMKARAVLQKQ